MNKLVEADCGEKLMYVLPRPEILGELARGYIRKSVQDEVHSHKSHDRIGPGFHTEGEQIGLPCG